MQASRLQQEKAGEEHAGHVGREAEREYVCQKDSLLLLSQKKAARQPVVPAWRREGARQNFKEIARRRSRPPAAMPHEMPEQGEEILKVGMNAGTSKATGLAIAGQPSRDRRRVIVEGSHRREAQRMKRKGDKRISNKAQPAI